MIKHILLAKVYVIEISSSLSRSDGEGISFMERGMLNALNSFIKYIAYEKVIFFPLFDIGIIYC